MAGSVRSEVGRPKALGGEFKGGGKIRSITGMKENRKGKEWRSGASRAKSPRIHELGAAVGKLVWPVARGAAHRPSAGR